MAKIIDDSLNGLQAIDPEHILDLSEIGEEEIDTFSEAIKEVVVSDHDKLNHRDYPDQHPISAITGLQEALDNSGKQIYRGSDQPIDENILIWIDTSAPTHPNAMLTSEGDWFITSEGEDFVVAESTQLYTSDDARFMTNDGKGFALVEQIPLYTSDDKEFYEATNKQFITKGEI